MRTFLKVAAVLMLSFGGYYLLMGLSALMASGLNGQRPDWPSGAIHG